MNRAEYKTGYVTQTFSYGKCGYIREVLGNVFYFNSKSFGRGRKRLKEGDMVVFTAGERTDANTGETKPYALNMINYIESLYAAMNEVFPE